MPELPHSDIETSAIGIGCAYLAAGSFTRHEHRLIHAAFDAGARHFDVSPQYGLGTAERVLGTALKAKRNHVTIATKAGIKRPNVPMWKLRARAALAPVRTRLRALKGARQSLGNLSGATRSTNYSATFIRSSLEESLTHLGTDYVDVFFLHAIGANDMTDELLTTLEQLKQTGKTRAIGIATDRGTTAEITAAHPNVFDCVQYSWSALDPALGPSEAPSRITHRALVRALAPMTTWLNDNPKTRGALSAASDADLQDPSTLARALIGASLAENADGISLVASRSIERTRKNVAMAMDPATAALGARFMTALRAQAPLPEVQE